MKPARVANRRADLSTIHILQKEVGLDHDAAEALKRAVTGVASSADMSYEQRSKYIGHLKRLKAARGGSSNSTYTARRPERERSVDDHRDERWSKARALWSLLSKHGQVRSDTDGALAAYVKRQTRVEHWRFLNGHQINAVIESLKAWCGRSGVEVENDG
jgi:phage gp16-like protein